RRTRDSGIPTPGSPHSGSRPAQRAPSPGGGPRNSWRAAKRSQRPRSPRREKQPPPMSRPPALARLSWGRVSIAHPRSEWLRLHGIRSLEHSSRKRPSVVILARNEERSIGKVVREAAAFADEVLVLDGKSTDRTAGEARAAGASVHPDPGLGKGSAVR